MGKGWIGTPTRPIYAELGGTARDPLFFRVAQIEVACLVDEGEEQIALDVPSWTRRFSTEYEIQVPGGEAEAATMDTARKRKLTRPKEEAAKSGLWFLSGGSKASCTLK